MFGFICGVIVCVGAYFMYKMATVGSEEQPISKEESKSKYDEWMNHREQLVKKHGPITDRVKTDPVYAAEQFHYLIDGMTSGAIQDRVCFLLNVVEKMECMNPDLIDYMKSAVSNTEINDYECIKQNLYDIVHGKA